MKPISIHIQEILGEHDTVEGQTYNAVVKDILEAIKSRDSYVLGPDEEDEVVQEWPMKITKRSLANMKRLEIQKRQEESL